MTVRILVKSTLAGVSLALACTGTQNITQTGPGTYRIRCDTPLAECLGQLERLCIDGFELESARETRKRAGVDAIGTGVEQSETSEAKVVCVSHPLIAGETRLERRPLCTPGETQSCVGPGGCRGGQACLPDGAGYAACDCTGSAEAALGAVPSSDPLPAGSLTPSPSASVAASTPTSVTTAAPSEAPPIAPSAVPAP
jgi:hypothetical protein